MKILVVDDEDIVLDSCKAVLEEETFEVMLVSSADEALDAMKDSDISLLLIDVKMPRHDGMYLMNEVRGRWPQVPIIVMSGYYTANTIKDAIQRGAAAFIAKPFEPEELIKVIYKVIKKGGKQ